EQASLPAQLRELDEALAAARVQAAAADAERGVVAELTAALEAASEAETLAADVIDAQRALRERGAELRAAADEVDRLRDLRFRGIAGALAAALVAGEPCAVCGSPEHPAPHTGDGEPVTQTQIDEAMARREAAAERDRAAAGHARAADQALAA